MPRFLKNATLLAASLFFYGWWDYRFLSLIVGTSFITFFISSHLDRQKKRKVLLVTGITANLIFLFFFKYYNFFAESAARVLQALHISVTNFELANLILPLGISFFTFQNLSYLIDVYRKQIQPIQKFPDFLLYISFFPQLVAGPIERATHLIPQVLKARTVTSESIRTGFYLVLLGYFKKTVIADNLSALVIPVFSLPASSISTNVNINGITVLLASYAFTFQIYCDFSGYSDIARGIARFFGFDLMINFRRPYFQCNPVEFWKAWHISLSTWLRDYLYIPLGGNRHGTSRTYRNLFLTMVIGGFWHGAKWPMLLWGGFHGTLLIAHRLLLKNKIEIIKSKVVKQLIFIHLIVFSWIIFRAESLSQLKAILAKFLYIHPSFIFNISFQDIWCFLFVIPLLFVEFLEMRGENEETWLSWNKFSRIVFLVTLFYAIVLFGNPDRQDFIYFQF